MFAVLCSFSALRVLGDRVRIKFFTFSSASDDMTTYTHTHFMLSVSELY